MMDKNLKNKNKNIIGHSSTRSCKESDNYLKSLFYNRYTLGTDFFKYHT